MILIRSSGHSVSIDISCAAQRRFRFQLRHRRQSALRPRQHRLIDRKARGRRALWLGACRPPQSLLKCLATFALRRLVRLSATDCGTELPPGAWGVYCARAARTSPDWPSESVLRHPCRRPSSLTAPKSRDATDVRTSSPISWPCRSLIALKPSRSRNRTVNDPDSRCARAMARSNRSCSRYRLGSPVSASWPARYSSNSSPCARWP